MSGDEWPTSYPDRDDFKVTCAVLSAMAEDYERWCEESKISDEMHRKRDEVNGSRPELIKKRDEYAKRLELKAEDVRRVSDIANELLSGVRDIRGYSRAWVNTINILGEIAGIYLYDDVSYKAETGEDIDKFHHR